jgi:nucleotide-binding universal stress UspA family protein
MDKLVLAVTDGSAAGQGALGWAAALCAATDSTLSVATAWQPEFSEMDPATYAQHLEAARQRLEDDWCAILSATGAAFEAVLLEGDPRQVIPSWAAEHEADLVVLGPHGRGRDHRHGGYVGSVTIFLAHNLGRPLVSVPLEASADAPERIVVGVDGSPPSLQAVQWCADWAPALGAKVSVVFAERPSGKEVSRTDPTSWYQRTLHSLEEWSARLRATRVSFDTRVIEQQVGHALAELATGTATDLLVVGTRGHGGFSDLLLGSTALRLLHHSDVPLLLVPASS